MSKKWYAIQTYSGHENRVKHNLEQRTKSFHLEDKIFSVVVPHYTEVSTVEGKRVEKTVQAFPGYVLIEMDFNEDVWHVVRNTPGVTKFVGSANRPVAMSDEEVRRIMHPGAMERQRYRTDISVGQQVKVTSGPFQDFAGKVIDVSLERGKLKVLVSIFGRETPVELDFSQAEKIVA